MVTDERMGIGQLERVDSIFRKHGFILPELRQNFEILINYYRKKADVGKELYYTNQLLKVDKTLAKDFTYLSSRIHKEYDTKDLLEKKEFLKRKSAFRLYLLIVISVLAIILIMFLTWRYYRERNIRLKYERLQKRLKHSERSVISDKTEEPKKTTLSPELILELSEKLRKFEANRGFTKKGLTQHDLASQLGTNYKYLSIYINEVKGINFKNYLNRLRINYITELLNSDRKYLNYTTEALAEECGVATRQSFSDLFQEINGIRPQDYIRQRQQEIRK